MDHTENSALIKKLKTELKPISKKKAEVTFADPGRFRKLVSKKQLKFEF